MSWKILDAFVALIVSLSAGSALAQSRGGGEPPAQAASAPDGDPETADDAPEPLPTPTVDAQFELGMRSGYALPLGSATGYPGDTMSQSISGQVPLWFEIGPRFAKKYFVGALASYGFGMLPSSCAAAGASTGVDVNCSGHDVRVGLEFIYHGGAKDGFDPWVGMGVGWEWLNISAKGTQGAQTATVNGGLSGPELLMLQTGFDYMAAPSVGLGLFIAFSVSQYNSESLSCSGDCAGVVTGSDSIDTTALHEWFFAGARATFLP